MRATCLTPGDGTELGCLGGVEGRRPATTLAPGPAELLRSRTDRTEDLLHHVEVQARLARIENGRAR